MTTTLHISLTTPHGRAARHLVENSALQHVVTITSTDGDTFTVEPPPWRFSSGEAALYQLVQALAADSSEAATAARVAAGTVDGYNAKVIDEALKLLTERAA